MKYFKLFKCTLTQFYLNFVLNKDTKFLLVSYEDKIILVNIIYVNVIIFNIKYVDMI